MHFFLVNYNSKWWVLDPNDTSSSRGFSLANFKVDECFYSQRYLRGPPLRVLIRSTHLHSTLQHRNTFYIKKCRCILYNDLLCRGKLLYFYFFIAFTMIYFLLTLCGVKRVLKKFLYKGTTFYLILKLNIDDSIYLLLLIEEW